MNILAICKPTGNNFLRHYTDNMPGVTTHLTRSAAEAWQQIESMRPDLILLEWANDLTAAILQRKKPPCPVIVRVHDHEVTTLQSWGGYRIDRVNWANADAVWFINKEIQKLFHQRINANIDSFFLPNAIDPARFRLTEKKFKRAGLLSLHFRERKGIIRAVFLAQACWDWDFYIRTNLPGPDNAEFYPAYKQAFDLSVHVPNLHWEDRSAADLEITGYPFADVNEWYADKAVILSTSTHEGFGYSIGEAMLTGAMPVVWNWPTATDFWGPYVNMTKSINEAAARLTTWEPGREQEYRDYVVGNFSPEVLVPVLMHKLKAVGAKVMI